MRGSSGRGRVFVAAVVASLVATASAAATPPKPPTPLACLMMFGVNCYSPAQIQRAYDLGPLYAQGLDGRGSTIVIVDPFGSPTIGHDLRVFDRAFHVPDPPVLRVIQPVGAVPPYSTTFADGEMVDKAGETTLDVEWSHAIAPGADIVLVETPAFENAAGHGFPQMMRAEDYVIRHSLGDVISQSFSLPEQNFGRARIESLRRTYLRAARRWVTVVGATNDNGVTGPLPSGLYYKRRVVQWPATDPLVTAVGGTALDLNAQGVRNAPDTVWNDTLNPTVSKLLSGVQPPAPWAGSGGVSVIFGRPAYQDSVKGVTGSHRGVPDVSLSAAFSGAVASFVSYPPNPPSFGVFGGTSEATPEFAGIVAIADQYARQRLGKRRLGPINAALYRLERRHAPGIVDITRGNNTVSFVEPSPGGPLTFTVKGYRATPGYDLASGIGTIDAAKFVPELARAG